MPSASTAKLEKQASSEATDPIKQGIVFVEHKIRNLMKKKGRLDSYKETQKSGKELDADQKQALQKYDELCQNLTFAQELSKQLNVIAQEAAKAQKKKEKKEAYEREQQECAKVKEILIIQDVLTGMGTDVAREDFLAGRNKAIKLTEAELQYLDDLFLEVTLQREPEEGQPPFLEQAQNAAKHLLSIVEGKDKEVVGTKYSVLKELIEKINASGYFDSSASAQPVAQETEEIVPEQMQTEEPVEAEPLETVPEPVPSATFQPSAAPTMEPVVVPVVETAGLFISQRPMADVLNVMGAAATPFNFIQESELESPEVGAVLPPPTALPIPSQTYTNANFTPSAAVPTAPPVYPPPQQEVMYVAPVPAPTQFSPVPPVQPAPPAQQFESNFQEQSQSGEGDWNDSTEQNNDWAVQVEQSEQNQWTEPTQQADDWAENSNDGFQTAGRGGGRGRGRSGGSDRGRGGPRGGRGSYQNGRGNYGNNRGGGGYYRNNNEGGNNYYQNGYQSRGDGERNYRDNREGGGYRDSREGGNFRENREGGAYRENREGGSYRDNKEGGPRRGGPRGERGGPRPDRGAPRGGGGRGGGGNPRGGNRGNRQ